MPKEEHQIQIDIAVIKNNLVTILERIDSLDKRLEHYVTEERLKPLERIVWTTLTASITTSIGIAITFFINR